MAGPMDGLLLPDDEGGSEADAEEMASGCQPSAWSGGGSVQGTSSWSWRQKLSRGQACGRAALTIASASSALFPWHRIR